MPDVGILNNLLQPPDKSKYYKEASKMILGTALGGLLANALGASDYFSAGIAKGGITAGQGFLEDMLEKEKQWQNLRNKLATQLVIHSLEQSAKTAEDERKRLLLSVYGKKLKELYQLHTDKNGNFDIGGFSKDASITALELGLDPSTSKEIQQSFVNAQNAIYNIDKAKAQTDMFKAHADLYRTRREKLLQPPQLKPLTESQIKARILEKYLQNPDALTKQERHILGLDINPYFKWAVQIVEKDPMASLLPKEKKPQIIKAIADDLKMLAEGSATSTAKPKRLDKKTALQILKEAGGDKEKARQIAKQRGYVW